MKANNELGETVHEVNFSICISNFSPFHVTFLIFSYDIDHTNSCDNYYVHIIAVHVMCCDPVPSADAIIASFAYIQ